MGIGLHVGQSQSEFIRWRLLLDDVIENIRLTLKGLQYRPDGTLVQVSEPVMNDYGVGLVTQVLRAYLHRGVILSDLDDHDIREITRAVHKDVADVLFKNFEQVDLDRAMFRAVCRFIAANVYATLRRARFGRERESIDDGLKVEERINAKEKGGIV